MEVRKIIHSLEKQKLSRFQSLSEPSGNISYQQYAFDWLINSLSHTFQYYSLLVPAKTYSSSQQKTSFRVWVNPLAGNKIPGLCSPYPAG